MSNLSTQDIFHLSHLARLALSEDEQVRFATQLSSVIGYVEQLSKVDTSKVGELKGVSNLSNILAADVPRDQDDLCRVNPVEIVAGAPLHSAEFFQVRAVFSDEVVSA